MGTAPQAISQGASLSQVLQYAHPVFLYPHLADAEQRAQRMFDDPVDQMAKQEDITDQLKANDMMTYVRKMNSVRKQTEEIVNHEIIFN